ncbi:zinc finger protein 280B-like, partial [Ctenocephalides felis]
IDKESKLCRYCLEIIPTEDELRRHIIQAHPNDTKNTMVNTLACVMCETRYSTIGLLAAHMSKMHVAFEMPYMCGTCNHRCSSHRVAIEHFYEDHDGDTSLQCPFCLQAMVIWAKDKPRIQTLRDFYDHLKNHMDRVTAKKCTKCALWFYDKGALREHILYAHKTQKQLSQYIKNNCISSTMVNRPKIKATPPRDIISHTVVENYDKLTMYVEDGLNCIECISDFGDRRHFL